MLHELPLGRMTCPDGVDQTLAQLRLRLLGSLQLLTQMPHLRLCLDQAVMVRGTSRLHPVGQAQELGLLH